MPLVGPYGFHPVPLATTLFALVIAPVPLLVMLDALTVFVWMFCVAAHVAAIVVWQLLQIVFPTIVITSSQFSNVIVPPPAKILFVRDTTPMSSNFNFVYRPLQPETIDRTLL
jgi:hypothetical protein